jgi:hypothetical protein
VVVNQTDAAQITKMTLLRLRQIRSRFAALCYSWQCCERFSALGTAFTAANLIGLPLAGRTAGDAQQISQASLRQANALAQCQHRLPKGRVVLTIERRGMGVLLAFRVTRNTPPAMRSKGKKDATCWRLTSPGTLAILRGVGCTEWRVWGML